MKLQKIKGNTYYIELSQNKTLLNCGLAHRVLIDPGINGEIAKELIGEIYSSGEKVEYILNTHTHIDHRGGLCTAKSITGATMLATKEQQPYIEQSYLSETFTYGARPPVKSLRGAEVTKVDRIVEHGRLELGSTHFEITPTVGHSLDHTVIETEDNVLFCGDILMSDELITDHKIKLMYDVEEMYKDLDFIEKSNYSHYVHSHIPVGQDHFPLIKRNRQLMDDMANIIYEFCNIPKGREEITGNLVRQMGILNRPSRYILADTAVAAYLSYFFYKGKMNMIFENGILKYVQK